MNSEKIHASGSGRKNTEAVRLPWWVQSVAAVLVITALIALFGSRMGLANALNTVMNTAYSLLMDTCFYIMAIAVITGAVSAILTEFGVVRLFNVLLRPLMQPIFGMPGASSLGIITTYLSDNPAILALASDRRFIRYFKLYQVPALTSLGTAFGMGLMVTLCTR